MLLSWHRLLIGLCFCERRRTGIMPIATCHRSSSQARSQATPRGVRGSIATTPYGWLRTYRDDPLLRYPSKFGGGDLWRPDMCLSKLSRDMTRQLCAKRSFASETGSSCAGLCTRFESLPTAGVYGVPMSRRVFCRCYRPIVAAGRRAVRRLIKRRYRLARLRLPPAIISPRNSLPAYAKKLRFGAHGLRNRLL